MEVLIAILFQLSVSVAIPSVNEMIASTGVLLSALVSCITQHDHSSTDGS